MMSLRKKTFGSILLLTLLAAVGCAFIVYELTRKQTEDFIGETQLLMTSTTLDLIDRFLYERRGDIQIISRISQVHEYLASPDVAELREESIKKYQEFINIYSSWDAIAVVDLSGVISISTQQDNIGKQLADAGGIENTLFQSALKGQMVFSDFYLSDTTGKYTLAFAAPVRSPDKENRIIGVAMGFVDWNIIIEILATTNIHTHLLNSKGQQIASANGRDTKDTVVFEDFSLQPAVTNALAGQRGADIFKDIDGERNVLVSYSDEAGYLDYPGNNWVLLLERPTEDIFAAIERTALLIAGLFTLGGIVFAALGISILNRIIIQPLRNLTAVTKKIAEGNLDQQLKVNSEDEIGKLSKTFNIMALSLKNSQTNLENKVAERTNTLAQKVEELAEMNKHMVDREIKMIALKNEIAEMKRAAGTKT